MSRHPPAEESSEQISKLFRALRKRTKPVPQHRLRLKRLGLRVYPIAEDEDIEQRAWFGLCPFFWYGLPEPPFNAPNNQILAGRLERGQVM